MTKQEQYTSLLPQIEAVMDKKADVIANMANMAAMLHETFGFWWTGFYRVIGDELVLGPFQGPLACTRIAYGRGVCGTAWKEHRTVVVPDVEQFPGHIACSAASRSSFTVIYPYCPKGSVSLPNDRKYLSLSTEKRYSVSGISSSSFIFGKTMSFLSLSKYVRRAPFLNIIMKLSASAVSFLYALLYLQL